MSSSEQSTPTVTPGRLSAREADILRRVGIDPIGCDDEVVILVRFACRVYKFDVNAVDYVKRVLAKL